MMAVHPQRTTKKQLKILRCEKCGLRAMKKQSQNVTVQAISWSEAEVME